MVNGEVGMVHEGGGMGQQTLLIQVFTTGGHQNGTSSSASSTCATTSTCPASSTCSTSSTCPTCSTSPTYPTCPTCSPFSVHCCQEDQGWSLLAHLVSHSHLVT